MDLFEKVTRFTVARELMDAGLYFYFRAIQSAQAPEILVNGKKMILVGSNNYLGLSDDPRMKQAAIEAVEKYGTGCNGSRFLNGTLDIHEQLEAKLAAFKHREAGLIYSTGYQANVGVVSCLLGRNDVVICDKYNHASIYDGARLSLGEVKRFKHNDMKDLETVLRSIEPGRGKLIAVDGVFSMEGDICPLPDIVELGKKYGCRIMVDDAHSTGVLGETGRGTCEHFGLENGEVDLILGTCSKSFCSVGGFVVGSADLIHYIKHTSRSMIFSAALPPANVATISKALDIIEEEPERRRNLWRNADKMRVGFKAMGFDTGDSETPIVPVLIGEDEKCLAMAKMLYENGVFANPVLSPAVPPGRAMMRTSYMATHTDQQLDQVLNLFEDCGRKLGLLPASRQEAAVS
jgi:8-amino-7-oxononanoate synthase